MTIGSVVKLKSGGPEMTITSRDTSDGWSTTLRWWCTWFEGTALRRESFPSAGLELA